MSSKVGITAGEVLARIESEIDSTATGAPTSALAERAFLLQEMQRRYRSEPVGGRFVALKRAFSWFSASTFDRQAKVIEALLDLVEDQALELDRLRAGLEALRLELARSRDGSDAQEP